jgi:methanogenic corrinoid protein MtbC1
VIKSSLTDGAAEDLLRLYSYILNNHEKNIALSQEIKRHPVELNQIAIELMVHVVQGDMRYSIKRIDSAFEEQYSLEQIYRDIITPIMYKVGDMWENGKISTAVEHLTSATISKLINHIQEKSGNIKPAKGAVVVTSVSNEYHFLGSKIVAALFEHRGWNVKFLGPNVPQKDLIQLLESDQSQVLAVSITMIYNLQELIEMINSIKKNPKLKKLKIMVGGLLVQMYPKLHTFLKVDHVASSIDDGLAAMERFKTQV